MVDLDVLQEEGGGSAFPWLAGSGAVLPRAEQEEEGDDTEVDGMAVDGALGWIPEGRRCVKHKWVLEVKRSGVFRARLVACGSV